VDSRDMRCVSWGGWAAVLGAGWSKEKLRKLGAWGTEKEK